jgi:antitoxin ParD1/3/4
MDIALPEDLEAFVRDRIRGGVSHSASEIMVEALYLLQDRDDLRRVRLERLRKDIAVGIEEAERGEAAPLDIEAIIAKARSQRAATRPPRAPG